MERVGPAQADNLVSSGQLGRRRGVVAGEDEAGGEAALGGFVGDLIGVGEEGHGEGTALPDLVFQGAERLVERVDDEVEGAVTAVASDGVWVGVDDEGGGADDAGGGRETRPCRTGKGGVDKFSGPAHGPADELAVEGEGVGLERGLFGRLVQRILGMGGRGIAEIVFEAVYPGLVRKVWRRFLDCRSGEGNTGNAPVGSLPLMRHIGTNPVSMSALAI